MRRRALRLAAALVALTLTSSAEALAVPSPPKDLTVNGGGEAWSPVNWFQLNWTNPESNPQIAKVHYRVLDPLGAVAMPDTPRGVSESVAFAIQPLRGWGVYKAEVWLEDSEGTQGAPAEAKLRIDGEPPGDAVPKAPETWISRTGIPFRIEIGHPSGEPPVSGIRGYAVSVDTSPRGVPCERADRCNDAETDLRSGVNGDSYTVEALPEGVSYVHAVAVSGSGLRSLSVGHAELRADKTDPVARLEGTPQGWAGAPVSLTAVAADSRSGMAGDDPGARPFTAIRVDGGTPTIAAGRSVTTTVIAEGMHRVRYYARDDAGNVNDGGTSNGQPNNPPAETWVRIDLTPPAVAFFGSEEPEEPELIRARVLDPLSGPSPSSGWIGVRPAGSRARFEPLRTTVAGSVLRAHWQSDAYPRGDYEFRAVGYDAAGNTASSTLRSDGTPMVLSNPPKVPASLSVALRPSLPVVAFGRSVRLSGRLIMGLRTPVEGAPVRIVERFDGRPRGSERVTTVRTGTGGSFSLRLASGPSRRVTAVFAGSGTLTRAAGRPLRLAVRSRVRLRASSATAVVDGRPLTFSGSVAAPRGVRARGRSVELQFRLPGLPWSEFRTVRTDSRGRFRYLYRFADDDSRGVRFQFRAYVPEQDGWPFEPGASKRVSVRGR